MDPAIAVEALGTVDLGEAEPGDAALCPIIGARVMIVDDNEFAIQRMRSILNDMGVTETAQYKGGADALAAVERFKPDLIIADLVMPHMSGFELVARLRSLEVARHTPILVQTGMESTEDRIRAFDVGASDLITKPIHPCETRARVRTLLENRRLIQRLSGYRRRMEEEIRSAAGMQFAILPKPETLARIQRRYGVAIDANYEASLFLGGDVWGVRPLDEDRLFFYIADFSGHGVAAAMNTFRLHTFIDRSIGLMATPSALMTEVNRFLMTVLPVGQFATMIAGVADVSQRRVTYVSAGGPAPIRVRAATGEAYYGEAVGPILRLSRKPDYAPIRMDFEPGDRFVLYSDVFCEDVGGAAHTFSSSELLSVVRAISRRSRREVFAQRLTEALAERVGRPFPDDLTVVSLQFHDIAEADVA